MIYSFFFLDEPMSLVTTSSVLLAKICHLNCKYYIDYHRYMHLHTLRMPRPTSDLQQVDCWHTNHNKLKHQIIVQVLQVLIPALLLRVNHRLVKHAQVEALQRRLTTLLELACINAEKQGLQKSYQLVKHAQVEALQHRLTTLLKLTSINA